MHSLFLNTLVNEGRIMDFLCFTIKENKIAIRILDVYVLIDKTEITHFPNQEGKSMYIINYFDELIPVFEVNNDFDVNKKCIVVIKGKNLFGLFVDSIDDIFRAKVPEGYELMSSEDFEILVRDGRNSRASEVELF